MPDLNTREAQLLQARERMARSFERLQKLVAHVPEKIKQLEAKSSGIDSRTSELQELLDRERVIGTQRIALDESNREEIKLLQLRVQSLEKDLQHAQGQISKKDATIVELESMLADFRAEVSQKDVSYAKLSDEHSTTKNITDEVLAKLDAMHDAYRILQQQCFRYESQIAQMNETDSAIAVKMNDSQRTTIIAEIDSIIASLDTLTPGNGIYSR